MQRRAQERILKYIERNVRRSYENLLLSSFADVYPQESSLEGFLPGLAGWGFTMKERQRIWQMRRKYGISGVPYDVNGDGICNFKDYAVFANVWKKGD